MRSSVPDKVDVLAVQLELLRVPVNRLDNKLDAETGRDFLREVYIEADDLTGLGIAVAHRREALVESENKGALVKNILERGVAVDSLHRAGEFLTGKESVLVSEPCLGDLSGGSVGRHSIEYLLDLRGERVVILSEAYRVLLGAEVVLENDILCGAAAGREQHHGGQSRQNES